MMQMLVAGGGRGGDVRLKLFLSLLWASPGDGHATQFDLAAWAQLLGLDGYSTKGKRRVSDALKWLESAGFVIREQQPGFPTRVTVLHESGSGEAYSKPSENPARGAAPSYRRLQSGWWMNGFMAGLSGRALAMWIVLMDESNNGRKHTVWLAESVTEGRYAMSAHLRQNALRELEAHGLIGTRRSFQREPFGIKSSRTEITIRPDALSNNPQYQGE